jgi:hypothetical protein
MAYGGIPLLNLYDVFVNYVFGGFWFSVLGLAGIMFVIMGPIGGITAFSVLFYLAMFFMAMGIGYGQAIVTVPIFVAVLIWFVWNIVKYIENRQ